MLPSNTLKSTNFPNLAGVPNCDEWIQKELDEAGVPIRSAFENWVVKKGEHSNGLQITNKLIAGDYEDRYRPTSEVPYHIKGELNGYTFRRSWYYWVVRGEVSKKIAKKIYKNPIGKRDVRAHGHGGCISPKGRVNVYHIDSQEGLNLFVKMINPSQKTCQREKENSLKRER